ADLTIAFMLMLLRHLPAVHETYRGGGARVEQASDYLALYTRFTGRELNGVTVGLVGLGAVGREVAARLAAFRARILAYDPYVAAPPPGVTVTALDELLGTADIVSLHAPVTPETQGMLSRESMPWDSGVTGACSETMSAVPSSSSSAVTVTPGGGAAT